METSPGEITRLLNELRQGDRSAEQKLIPLVYEELLRRARQRMRHESPGHTLQPTALVHEAYLKLVEQREISWQCRAHFYAVASELMRRILVDHARRKRAGRRPPPEQRVSLDPNLEYSPGDLVDVIAVDQALKRLAQQDPRQARIVELRIFGGLSVEETAEAMGHSTRQVKRDWSFAKAWLHGELSKGSGESGGKAKD